MADCGIRSAKGEPCILDEYHGMNVDGAGWRYRVHETATGYKFDLMSEREKARPYKGQLRYG